MGLTTYMQVLFRACRYLGNQMDLISVDLTKSSQISYHDIAADLCTSNI